MWTSSGQIAGYAGSACAASHVLHRVQLGVAPGQPAAPQRDHAARRGQRGVARRPDRRQEPPHLDGDPGAHPVAGREAVGHRRLVAEPEVQRGEVARARLEEEALGGRDGLAERLAQGVREVGVPAQGLAAEAGAVAGERHDHRERPPRAVHPQHGHRVVHGPLRVDAVDRDPGRPPDPAPDRHRLEARARPVDGARDPLGERGRVALVAAHRDQGPDAAGIREDRRAVVVGGVEEDGLRGDAGQLVGALAGGGGELARDREEVGRDDGDPARAVVEDEGLGQERLRDRVGPAGAEPPGARLQAERRGDVDRAHPAAQPGHVGQRRKRLSCSM